MCAKKYKCILFYYQLWRLKCHEFMIFLACQICSTVYSVVVYAICCDKVSVLVPGHLSLSASSCQRQQSTLDGLSLITPNTEQISLVNPSSDVKAKIL